VLYKDGAGAGWEHEPTEAGTFDAVISTIPVPFLRNLDIYCGATNISPREALFETDSLFKMQLQFKTRFWNDTRNNRGHFRVSNERGFLTSTDSVAKLRYPRWIPRPGR
jgi:monoamine oxidase